MLLYHFTAEHLLPSVLKAGIDRGGVPLHRPNTDEVRFLWGHMWLTQESDFSLQSWDDLTNAERIIPYSRTDVRLLVSIPQMYHDRIFTYEKMRKTLRRKYGNIYVIPDALLWNENPEWRVYHGVIPRTWIREIKLNPETIQQENSDAAKANI